MKDRKKNSGSRRRRRAASCNWRRDSSSREMSLRGSKSWAKRGKKNGLLNKERPIKLHPSDLSPKKIDQSNLVNSETGSTTK